MAAAVAPLARQSEPCPLPDVNNSPAAGLGRSQQRMSAIAGVQAQEQVQAALCALQGAEDGAIASNDSRH